MIFHSENYGCQIGTGTCRNLCPVQIHPGGFPAALENQILCGLCPQEFGAITATHIPQTESGNLIPSFCQKGDKSIISTGSICNHLRMLPIFSFFCVVKHHRWYRDLIDVLSSEFPLGQPITGEQKQKNFIKLYGNILRLKNILSAFDQFAGHELLPERDFQDYQSVYLDLYQVYRPKTDGDKKTSTMIFPSKLNSSGRWRSTSTTF